MGAILDHSESKADSPHDHSTLLDLPVLSLMHLQWCNSNTSELHLISVLNE